MSKMWNLQCDHFCVYCTVVVVAAVVLSRSPERVQLEQCSCMHDPPGCSLIAALLSLMCECVCMWRGTHERPAITAIREAARIQAAVWELLRLALSWINAVIMCDVRVRQHLIKERKKKLTRTVCMHPWRFRNWFHGVIGKRSAAHFSA